MSVVRVVRKNVERTLTLSSELVPFQEIKEDDAAVYNATAQIPHARDELKRVEAQHKVLELQFQRLDNVANSKPGLAAQQEVDDSQGRALASAAQVEAAKSNLQSAESMLAAAEAKREHDQALFDYPKSPRPSLVW